MLKLLLWKQLKSLYTCNRLLNYNIFIWWIPDWYRSLKTCNLIIKNNNTRKEWKTSIQIIQCCKSFFKKNVYLIDERNWSTFVYDYESNYIKT